MRKPALLFAAVGTLLAAGLMSAPTAATASYETHAVAGCARPATIRTPASPVPPPGVPASFAAQAIAHHALWLPALTCVEAGQTAAISTIQTPIWSGYYDLPSVNASIAQANWHVPAVGRPASPAVPDYSVIWVGIGNPGQAGAPRHSELLQDGTEQIASCKVSNSKCVKARGTYYFWFEAVPGEFVQRVTNLAVTPGQSVGAAVWWTKGVAGLPSQATFGLCNFSRKPTAECVYKSQNEHENNDTAEWIAERPELCINHQQHYSVLAPFGNVTFTQAGFDTKRTGRLKYSIAQGNPDRVIMKSGKNTLATPSNSLHSGGRSFTDTWHEYGTAGLVKPVMKC